MSPVRAVLCLSAFVVAVACGDDDLPLEPHEGYVEVEGGRIWYQVTGSGPGTPLIILHGGPGAPSYYLASLGLLGNERPVIFYDQLGAGRSDMPSDTTLWRIDRFVVELQALRDHLHLDQVHILGHSWGTILGTEYVLAHPEGVRSLVLASPALNIDLWEADADTLIATMPDSIQRAIATHEADGSYDAPAYQAAVNAFYARYLTREGGPDVDSTFAHFGAQLYGYMWGPSEFTGTGTLRHYDITGRLGELRLPVLYTTGEFDEARPPTVQHYRSLTPGSEFVLIPGSGHLTSIDAPEAFTDAIREFLRRVEQR